MHYTYVAMVSVQGILRDLQTTRSIIPSESEARLKGMLDVMLPVRYGVSLPPAPKAWTFLISTRFQIRRFNWAAST